jgi:hypothetical protein
MPQRTRPNSEKANLVDELARLGGDDLRFWEEDGTGTVDNASAEYKAYSKVSVAVLRSRVANFAEPPSGEDEQEESEEEEQESDDEQEESEGEQQRAPFGFESGSESGSDEEEEQIEEEDSVAPAAAAVARTPAPAPAPWFRGIFGSSAQPADLIATKSRVDTGDFDDDEDARIALAARDDVATAIGDAEQDSTHSNEIAVITAAVGAVLNQTEREDDPVKKATLVAVMSNEIDLLQRDGHLPQFTSAEPRSEEEQKQLGALQTRLQRDGWDRVPPTDSQLTPKKPATRDQFDEARRVLKLDQAGIATVTSAAPSEAFQSPTGSAPPASPHVSTATSQHDDTAAATARHIASTAASPPVAPRPLDAVVQNLVAQQVQQQMAALAPAAAAPAARRIGSLNQGAPAQDTARNIGIVMQNLEDAPLVAGLLSQGLLKTEDVLNDDYVTEMEAVLRKRKATKEVVGRDVRYRTARAAYRPPVNVTTTATPGVYKYQRPRFARPMIG